MYRYLVASLLVSLPFCASAQVYNRAPACDRACLTGFMDRYLEAQAANALGNLPLAPTVRVTENGDLVEPGAGFFRRADEPTYRMDIADPETGGVASALVVNAGDVQAFEMVRLKVEGGLITEVET